MPVATNCKVIRNITLEPWDKTSNWSKLFLFLAFIYVFRLVNLKPKSPIYWTLRRKMPLPSCLYSLTLHLSANQEPWIFCFSYCLYCIGHKFFVKIFSSNFSLLYPKRNIQNSAFGCHVESLKNHCKMKIKVWVIKYTWRKLLNRVS